MHVQGLMNPLRFDTEIEKIGIGNFIAIQRMQKVRNVAVRRKRTLSKVLHTKSVIQSSSAISLDFSLICAGTGRRSWCVVVASDKFNSNSGVSFRYEEFAPFLAWNTLTLLATQVFTFEGGVLILK